MTLYYADIASTGSSGDYGGVVALSGHAAALLLALLAESVDIRELWQAGLDDDTEVTDAQWDIIDAWFGAAGEGLMTSLAGMIVSYASVLPPSGTLVCDGTQYLRVDYPRLYAAIDPVYIVDADNFTVPDLRDRFVVGESATSVVGDTGGAASVALARDEMPNHRHRYEKPIMGTIIEGLELPAAAVTSISSLQSTTLVTGHSQPGDIALPHENRPPFYVVRYGIMT